MTTDSYPVPVLNTDWNEEFCNRCRCGWECEVTHEPNRKRGWCSEPDPGHSGCICHTEWFTNSFLEKRGLRNPVIVEGEEVIGWVEPFTSFRDDVA